MPLLREREHIKCHCYPDIVGKGGHQKPKRETAKMEWSLNGQVWSPWLHGIPGSLTVSINPPHTFPYGSAMAFMRKTKGKVRD